MKERELIHAMNQIEISEDMQNRILENAKQSRKEGYIMKSKKRLIPMTLAATLILGITVFAAATHWSHGFMQHMNISRAQMEQLQSKGNSPVAMPDVSDTQNGITVTAAQCLFDGNSIRMSFYVEGYELDKTEEPELEYVNIFLDGETLHNYDWSFFNGIDWSDKKNPVMADGSPVKEDENGNYISNYRIADGKMELNLNCSPYIESGKRLSEDELKNKKITVMMQNFGNTKGVWKLEWNLGDLEKGKQVVLNVPLGDTDITVNDVTLYAASAIICYDFPKTEVKIDAYDENGKLYKTTDFAEPPALVGVKLTDGTVITDLNDGGSGGYENGNMNEFVARVNLSHIIEWDEVESLLFVKNSLENGEAQPAEDDCYIVVLSEK